MLEVILAAKRRVPKGRVIEIESEFPPPDYSHHAVMPQELGYLHDPRSVHLTTTSVATVMTPSSEADQAHHLRDVPSC